MLKINYCAHFIGFFLGLLFLFSHTRPLLSLLDTTVTTANGFNFDYRLIMLFSQIYKQSQLLQQLW